MNYENNDTEFFEADLDNDDLPSYSEPQKITNKFYQAQKDYEVAMREGLDGEGLLNKYIKRGELMSRQAEQIKNNFGGLAPKNNEFKLPYQAKKEEKTFTLKKNFSSINIQPLDDFKPLEFVCKRFKLVKGNLVAVVAAGGSGKSLFLQYLAVCVASGKKLFSQFDICSGKVLHIDQEQTERLTNVRYSRIAKGLEVTEIKNIDRLIIPRIDVHGNNLEDVEAQLVDLFKNYSIVIVDSLKKLSNADENTADIEPIVTMLQKAAEKSKSCVLMIHHMGKSKGKAIQSGRGHSSIYDSVDMQIDLEHDAKDVTGTVELECVKNREGAVFSGLTFRFRDEGEKHVGQDCSEQLVFELVNEDSTIMEKKVDLKVKILKVLEAGQSNKSSLFDQVKGDRNTFDKALEECLNESNKYIAETKGAKGARLLNITESGKMYLSYNDEVDSNEK